MAWACLNEHKLLMQGTCKNNVCVCPQGFRGDYCEIAPACSGILDQAGNCCPHGIVDINGTCCSSVRARHLSETLACRHSQASHLLAGSSKAEHAIFMTFKHTEAALQM